MVHAFPTDRLLRSHSIAWRKRVRQRSSRVTPEPWFNRLFNGPEFDDYGFWALRSPEIARLFGYFKLSDDLRAVIHIARAIGGDHGRLSHTRPVFEAHDEVLYRLINDPIVKDRIKTAARGELNWRRKLRYAVIKNAPNVRAHDEMRRKYTVAEQVMLDMPPRMRPWAAPRRRYAHNRDRTIRTPEMFLMSDYEFIRHQYVVPGTLDAALF